MILKGDCNFKLSISLLLTSYILRDKTCVFFYFIKFAQHNYELYEVAQFVISRVFYNITNKIIPESCNFILCAFSSNFNRQNV